MAFGKRIRAGRSPILGELEMIVLHQLWSDGPLGVREMHRRIVAERGIKPNTVQSAMERLHRKGLAERQKVGRAYIYNARSTQKDWVMCAVQDLVEGVPGFRPDALLSTFVDLAERAGEDTLGELERLVRERRGRRGGSNS